MTGRTIALYPGAFRPPHANHLAVVDQLVGLADEVVVIVSNRSRWVPRQDRFLPPSVGVEAWGVLLGGRYPTVSVVAAPASGVAEAIAMVERADTGIHHLLCVGEKDRAAGLGRFSKMAAVLPAGVTAEVVTGVPPVVECSASDLRRAVGHGDRASFARGYPGEPDAVVDAVWVLCRTSGVSAAESARRTIIDVLDLDAAADVSAVPPRTGVPRTFLVGGPDESATVVRYANDAVSGRASPGHGRRDGVWVERNALQWAKKAGRASGVQVPQIRCFDRRRATLALTPVLPAGEPLVDAELSASQWRQVAHRLGAFVGHAQAPGVRLMRSRSDKDRAAFDRRVEALFDLGVIASDLVGRGGPCFGHLALCADNVRVDFPHVGVVDFERASSWAAPMVDLATLQASLLARPREAGVREAITDGTIEGYVSARGVRPDDLVGLPAMVESLVFSGVAGPDGVLRELSRSAGGLDR